MAGDPSKQPIAVYAAIGANFLIAVTKFLAAAFTGSSAMLSEGIHSVVDTGNQSLVLLGIRQSKKPADQTHPFGYGKELYFWSLIVAIILFGLGGGMSFYEGITHLQHPTEIGDPTWNYIVLAAAAVFEMVAFYLALRELLRARRPEESLFQAVRSSKDPAVFVVLFEDAAALAGLIIAFFGVLLGAMYENPVYDAVASILIGVVLTATAIFMAYETRSLLVGESLPRQDILDIVRLSEADLAVEQVRRPLTMHFGPEEVLLTMDVDFKDDLAGNSLAEAIVRLEEKIREKHPEIKHIFLEARSLAKAQQSKPAPAAD